VLRRGSRRYPDAMHLNRRLDELYASSVEIKGAKHGKNESVIFASEILDARYVPDGTDLADGVAEVVAQMLYEPLTQENGDFPHDTVEKEKINVCDAVRALIHNPRAYAAVRCAEIMGEGEEDHATMEELLCRVEQTDAHALRVFYDELLERAVWSFFYVGSAEQSEIEALIHRHFAPCLSGEALSLRPLSAQSDVRGRRVEEQLAVSQGKLAIGLRTGVHLGDPDCYAMLLANEILGASPASKLFLNVRERMGLCYYCSSSYNLYSGNMLIGAGIDVKDREIAEREILAQLKALQQGQISSVELYAARQSLANSYRQIYDNPFELHAFYHGRSLFGMKQTVEECREALDKVSVEQIVAAANKIVVDATYFLEGDGTGEEDSADE